jgi:hypothetical protein
VRDFGKPCPAARIVSLGYCREHRAQAWWGCFVTLPEVFIPAWLHASVPWVACSWQGSGKSVWLHAVHLWVACSQLCQAQIALQRLLEYVASARARLTLTIGAGVRTCNLHSQPARRWFLRGGCICPW